MAKQVDSHNFLIGKLGLGVITQALKAGDSLRIVKLADEQIELNELIFHRKKILPNQLTCLPFQPLIHIEVTT
ncbi:MAG TPA: hypothetical protein PKC13_01040 [Blastocatellia bacterium]|nr:hypothetical protein [Blastocatellia bacterium]